MMGLFSFLNKKEEIIENQTRVDIHSHLIFGVDDGSQTLEESISLIKSLFEKGYTDIITSPHIMADFYKNSKDNLLPIRDIIREELQKQNIKINFDVAAEYYLDDGFEKKLRDKENLLLINDEYILVETSYMNEPSNLNSIMFEIQASGLKPILAHPERYSYMYDSFEKYEAIFERNVYFQLNLNSLSGYYSKAAKDIANKLIDKKMIHFSGTDCHGEKHINALTKVLSTKGFQKLQQLPLLNNSLAK